MSTKRPKIVVLDGYTLNPGDLSWTNLQALGETVIHEYTPPEKIVEHCQGAQIVLSNKAIINGKAMAQLPDLQCICLMATGYNNIDTEAARRHRIAVCNAVGYGTTSVAQHVFALILELTNKIALHNQSVQEKQWTHCRDFSYHLQPIAELAGKTMGIYGLGQIGNKVADIALAFEMRVLATHKHPERDQRPGVAFVTIEELFAKSDFISLHAPLSDDNAGIVNEQLLSRMKSTAYLINTGRGGLINEADLKAALTKGTIAGAGLDVLSVEPPPADHILYGLENCLITPHQAWASQEARGRLMDIVVENVKAFLRGAAKNVVNEL